MSKPRKKPRGGQKENDALSAWLAKREQARPVPKKAVDALVQGLVARMTPDGAYPRIGSAGH